MFGRSIWPVALFTILLMAVFLAGLYIGNQGLSIVGDPHNADIPENLLTPLYDAWSIVHDQYLNKPVDDVKLMQGAIRGMMESLEDPYSAYMNPEEYLAQSTPLEGEYTGIGAWVDTTGELLVIISPMPESPAEKMGIMPGDAVIGINGEDMTGIDPTLVLQKILGPAGSTVKLTIRRDVKTLEIEVERAVITVPSVESTLMEGNIGYIRLYNFGANSANEVMDAYDDLWEQGATKLIFDLRNNAGGFVDSAVDITSLFTDENDILIEEWGDGSQKVYSNTGSTLNAESPMIVLINEGSASASEIMAGALQDYGRAKLIGTTTFGKGYIQIWDPLVNDFGAVRLTIARWLTPSGRQIQGEGLAPNISVILTEEDIQNENDLQLNRAVEYLNNPD